MTIKLDNPKIEQFFIHQFKSDIKAFSEFILKNLEEYKHKNEFNVVHLDPKKHAYRLEFDDLGDVKAEDNPFKDVEDVVSYAKELREKSWR